MPVSLLESTAIITRRKENVIVKKFIALALVFIISGSALGASRKSSAPAKIYTPRQIPQDLFLPHYANPQEVDIMKGKMHVSFKGLFRGVDEWGRSGDWVYFAFAVTPQEDMYLAVSQSELFDNHANIYKYHAVPDIGGVRAFGREIIAGITVPVLLGVNMPLSEAGEYPSVSRITVTFNDEALQFRNIIAEDWGTWQELRETLALKDGAHE